MKNLFLIIYLIAVALLITCYAANCQTWKPNPKFTSQRATKTTDTTKAKFQCWGTTKKGDRCKRKVNADHSFCYQHTNQQ